MHDMEIDLDPLTRATVRLREAIERSQLDPLNFQNLVRESARMGVISDLMLWFDFRKMRNITSHTYDEKNAKLVYQTAVLFLAEVETLIQNIYDRTQT
jgi:nucleotidyltransferase substrate binding protein (TIGR01987 family)